MDEIKKEVHRYQAPLTDPKKYIEVLDLLIEIKRQDVFINIATFGDTVVFSSEKKEHIELFKKELLTRNLIKEL